MFIKEIYTKNSPFSELFFYTIIIYDFLNYFVSNLFQICLKKTLTYDNWLAFLLLFLFSFDKSIISIITTIYNTNSICFSITIYEE